MSLADIGSELPDITSHFYALDVERMKLFSVRDLDRILSSDYLKLRDENWLLDNLIVLGEYEDEYFSLLRHVHIEYLDLIHTNKFLECVYPGRLDAAIWSSICKLLRGGYKAEPQALPSVSPSSRALAVTYRSVDAYPFDGIIGHLAKECGGNVHVKGVVNITSSSNAWNECHEVTDYGSNDRWYTEDDPNS